MIGFARGWLIFVALGIGWLHAGLAAETVDPLPLRRNLQPTVAATLAGIQKQQATFFVDGKSVAIRLADIQRFGDWQDASRGAQVLLVDESILIGDILQMTSDEILLGDAAQLGRCRWSDIKIPLSAIRGIHLQPPAKKLDRDVWQLKLSTVTQREDELQLTTGDTLAGICLGTTGSDSRSWQTLRFQLKGSGRAAELPAEKVRGIAFNTTLLKPVNQPPEYWLGLRDGNLLAVRRVTVKKNKLQLELIAGINLETDLMSDPDLGSSFWQEVTLLWPASEKVFAEIIPTQYAYRPFSTIDWPLGTNASAKGGRLRSRSGVALQGWGVHAGGMIEIPIPSNVEMLEVETVLDGAENADGSLQFAILAPQGNSWREVAVSAVMRVGDQPQILQARIAGITKLRLETRVADRGEINAHGNWNYPRFISKSPR